MKGQLKHILHNSEGRNVITQRMFQDEKQTDNDGLTLLTNHMKSYKIKNMFRIILYPENNRKVSKIVYKYHITQKHKKNYKQQQRNAVFKFLHADSGVLIFKCGRYNSFHSLNLAHETSCSKVWHLTCFHFIVF